MLQYKTLVYDKFYWHLLQHDLLKQKESFKWENPKINLMKFTLETRRLHLRPFEKQDITVFSRYRSDPDIAMYQSWNTPFTIEQAARFVTEMEMVQPGVPGEWFQLALVLKSNQEMVGDIAFQILQEDHHQAEIGFTLDKAYHGQGFASEAVKRLLAYLFDDLALHRVRANCDPDNAASTRLLKRIGMRHEGRFIESLWFKGRWADEDWYAILRREWQEQEKNHPLR